MPRTPGKIHHNEALSRHGHQLVYGEDGQVVLDTLCYRRSDQDNVANAAHAVECWNACESMAMPENTVQETALALAEASEFLACGTPIRPHSDVAWALINAGKVMRPKAGTTYPYAPHDMARNTPRGKDALDDIKAVLIELTAELRGKGHENTLAYKRGLNALATLKGFMD